MRFQPDRRATGAAGQVAGVSVLGDLGHGTFKVRHGFRRFTFPKRGTKDHILDNMNKRGRFYEVDLLKALQKRLKGKSGVALDCGANIGNHSVFFSGVLGLDVFAFEPVPENASLLQQAIDLNRLGQRIQVVQSALGNAPGSVSIGLATVSNPGAYSIGEPDNAIEVPLVTLDSFCETKQLSPKNVALMKVDVEGYEGALLDGAHSLLSSTEAVLSIELTGIKQFDEIYGVLDEFGYAALEIHCATPTVIFEKQLQDKALLAQIRAVQIAYSERKGLAQ